jgi:hypothetical protein
LKIYDFKGGAPSPRKVRVFLAEKGIDVPYEEVDIQKRESRTPEFKKKNSPMRLPAPARRPTGFSGFSTACLRIGSSSPANAIRLRTP